MGHSDFLKEAIDMKIKATKMANEYLKDTNEVMSKEENAHVRATINNDPDIIDMLAIAKRKGINIDGFKF